MNDKKNLRFLLLTVFLALSCASFILGMMRGGFDEDCSYQSIAAIINIPYRLGCELTLPRFK